MKKILIVEDDFMLTMINVKYLQFMGHEVVATVTNGKEAIEAVRKHLPDLVLMDVRLDGELDGVETMKEISAFSNVPVIYLTGNSTDEKRARESGTNIIAFCVKPVHFEQLQNLIAKL